MIDFQPTEEQLLMIRAVSQFAAGLRPNIREFEHAREVPLAVLGRRSTSRPAMAAPDLGWSPPFCWRRPWPKWMRA